MMNKLYKIGLIAGLVSTFTLGTISPAYTKEKPKKPTKAERLSSIEDVCQVPTVVRKFRDALNLGPEGRSYVLVELAPGMKKYILTDKDGDFIRSFAKHELHMNDEDLEKLVHKKPEDGHVDYLTYAFNCSVLSPLYNRIESVVNKLDKNLNLVIEPSERY